MLTKDFFSANVNIYLKQVPPSYCTHPWLLNIPLVDQTFHNFTETVTTVNFPLNNKFTCHIMLTRWLLRSNWQIGLSCQTHFFEDYLVKKRLMIIILTIYIIDGSKTEYGWSSALYIPTFNVQQSTKFMKKIQFLQLNFMQFCVLTLHSSITNLKKSYFNW